MMSDPTFAIVIIGVCGAAAVTVRTIADATVRHAQATRGNDQAQRSMQRLDRPGKTDTPH